jgi:Fe-S cluster assembly scaffold protein SufB
MSDQLRNPSSPRVEDYGRPGRERDYKNDLSRISPGDRRRMAAAGLDFSGGNRSGTFIQMEQSVVHARSREKGVEVMGLEAARARHGWVDGHLWKLIRPDQDDYTREVSSRPPRGYFLRAARGVKARFPLQACLFLGKDSIRQEVHNLIIAEEGSDLNIINGCAAGSRVRQGLHLGISEIYVRKGASVTVTMIHNWGEDILVRPRTAVRVESGGRFTSNYVCLQPVRNLQMYPTAVLEKRASARFSSILFAPPGSFLDVGARVILRGEGSRAEIISRAVSNGGTVIARGYLRGEAPGVKAHLECQGLIVSRKGRIHAVPELEALVSDLDMSHEAAIGKIARDEVEYLMARGLSETDAVSTIVRGFMDASILGIPSALREEIDRAIQACQRDSI